MAFLGDLCGYIIGLLGYCLYCLLWMIINIFQKLMQLKRLRYEDSCQVLNIVWRRKFFLIDVVSPNDFIAFHEKFTHPSYIQQPSVSLYCLTTEFAYFVQTSENVNIHSMDVNPFQYIGQFKHAVKVIKLPTVYFFRLANEIGNPSQRVCFMPNTGRCGSTLVAKALDNVSGTLLHAEPDCLTNLGHIWKSKAVTQAEYEEFLIATVRILCKPRPDIDRIIIKTRTCGTCHTTAISKHFPRVKILFGYRNSMKTISSFLGLMLSETAQSLALHIIDDDFVSAVLPWFRRRMFFYFCYMLESSSCKGDPVKMNAVEQFTYAWASCITTMRNFKLQGGEFTPILYEDLNADKVGTLQTVFQTLDIDEKYMECALNVFVDDSQAGSPLSRENIKNIERRRVKSEHVIKANTILSEFSLPNIGVEFRFTG